MGKTLSLNGPEAECIPSADLVRMLARLAEKEQKPVAIIEVKLEGRAMKLIGKGLLVAGSLYFAVHILIWAVRS